MTQLIKVGDFGLIIPDKDMYRVATLDIDLRPAILSLKSQSGANSKVKVERTTHGNYRCSVCKKTLKMGIYIRKHIASVHGVQL